MLGIFDDDSDKNDDIDDDDDDDDDDDEHTITHVYHKLFILPIAIICP